ncbi:MAG: hypothetical protein O2788_01385, partial [Chloroflexi bacterium]|nr:hypothetical protein [Chloroflexota bacterium]
LKHIIPPTGHETYPETAYAYKLRVINDSDVTARKPFARFLAVDAKIKIVETQQGAVTVSEFDDFDLEPIPVPAPIHWVGQGKDSTPPDIGPGDETAFHLCYSNEVSGVRDVTFGIHTSDDTRKRYRVSPQAIIFVVSAGSEDHLPVFAVCEIDPSAPLTEPEMIVHYTGRERPSIADYQDFRPATVRRPNPQVPDTARDAPKAIP